jgi:SWIM zinc finger
MGAVLLEKQWKERLKYVSFAVSASKFHVRIDNASFLEDEGPGLIPRFKRVREVFIDENKEGRCTCYYFERFGIPCRHVLAVFSSLAPNDYEPAPRDIRN